MRMYSISGFRHLRQIAALFVVGLLATPAMAFVLPNGTPKWGSPTLGTGATITWGLMPEGTLNTENDVLAPKTNNLANVYSQVGGAGAALTMFQATFATWAGAANLTFVQVSDNGATVGARGSINTSQPNIRIGAYAFTDGSSLAHAYFPPFSFISPAFTIGGDIHINHSRNWASEFDLQTTFLHELGHALGLDHSGVAGSVMNAAYSGVRRSLTADDVAGITTLYGVSPVPEPSMALLLGGGLLLVVAAGRRRSRAAA